MVHVLLLGDARILMPGGAAVNTNDGDTSTARLDRSMCESADHVSEAFDRTGVEEIRKADDGSVHPVVTADSPMPLQLYGATVTESDLAPIPSVDLPAGLPDWMSSLDARAERTGSSDQEKRATITVTVPKGARTWPVLSDRRHDGLRRETVHG